MTPNTSTQGSSASSSLTRLKHEPAATWRSYIYFQFLVRIAVYFRARRRRTLGIGNLHPPGPQNFSELLKAYQNGGNAYANAHGVLVEWYEPASDALFASKSGKNYFDWSATRVLRFQPKSASDAAPIKRTILFFNGGAFIDTASPAHSYFCSVLAHRLNACVYMFPYELAPTGSAASQLPKATDFYLRVSTQARKEGHEIIIAGDSAGGSITACMPQCIHTFAPLLLDPSASTQDTNKLQPDQLLLISPLVTCNSTPRLDEAMAQIQPQDWWLSQATIDQVSHLWLGSPLLQAETLSHFVSASDNDDTAAKWKASLPMRTDSPIVDPFGSSDSFALLRQSNVHVTLLCGTYDILYAHAELYAEECERNNASCTFIQGTAGVHVYPILGYVGTNAGCEEAIDLCVTSILRASSAAKA